MSSSRRGFLQPRNDTVVWVQNVVDDCDPVESDGSPKWDNGATVTWTLLDCDTEDPDVALLTGVSLATGSATIAANADGDYDGTYLIEISRLVAIAETNWLHVQVITSLGFYADFMARFDKMTRSGATIST